MLSSGEGEPLAIEPTAGCLIRIISKKGGGGSSPRQKESVLEKRLAQVLLTSPHRRLKCFQSSRFSWVNEMSK